MLCWIPLAVLLFVVGQAKSDDLQSIPEFNSYLVDTSVWLSSQENLALRQKLEEVKSAGKVHIAVLIIDSTKPEAIEQYSIRVAEKWKVGKKGVDNGILILIAKQDKRIRIDVGYGLEGVIPDAIANRIITDDMKPLLKGGKTYDALNIAVDRIVWYVQKEGSVQSEKVEAPVAKKDGGLTGIDAIDSLSGGALVFALILAFISMICFFIETGWAILVGVVVPFLGGAIFIPALGFATAVTIAIGALVLAIILRFGLSIGSSAILDGGDFGGGGSSGGWGD